MLPAHRAPPLGRKASNTRRSMRVTPTLSLSPSLIFLDTTAGLPVWDRIALPIQITVFQTEPKEMASDLDSVLSSINTPFFSEGVRIVQIFYQLYVADERTGDLLKTIRHITLNVENVRRLRRLNADHLSTGDLAWIDALIVDAEDAMGGLATLVERARVDKETKENISWWNKGCWVAYYGPKVKEKYLKLTMCHQSLLSVFPFLFNKNGGLASVLEETKEDDQRPYDPTMMKWLGWQDQRQRRKSTVSLRRATPSQRPMSVSSGSTDVASASAVSSNGSASTGPKNSEASSPRGSEIRMPYYPATSSKSSSPTSAIVSPEYDDKSSGIDSESPFSGSQKSLQSCGSPDFVRDCLGLTYPFFHNSFEDNYEPQSALPEGGIEQDGTSNDLAQIFRVSNVYDGADGSQVYVPPNGSGALPDWIHQLQISPPDSQIAEPSKTTSIKQSSNSRVDADQAVRRGGAFAMPSKTRGGDGPMETEQKATPGRPLQFSSYLPAFEFERPISRNTSPSIASQLSEIQSLNPSEDGDELSLEGKKPLIDRVHSDTYAPGYSVRNRPGVCPSDRVLAGSGGGRPQSAGQRGAGRGSRSWLTFHSSRSDLSRGDGWGEG